MGHASSVVANQTTVVSSTDVKTLSLQSYFSEADVQALLAVYKARTSAGGSLHNPGSVHTMHTHYTALLLHCTVLHCPLCFCTHVGSPCCLLGPLQAMSVTEATEAQFNMLFPFARCLRGVCMMMLLLLLLRLCYMWSLSMDSERE